MEKLKCKICNKQLDEEDVYIELKFKSGEQAIASEYICNGDCLYEFFNLIIANTPMEQTNESNT